MSQEIQVRSVPIMAEAERYREVEAAIAAGQRNGSIIGMTAGRPVRRLPDGRIVVFVDMPNLITAEPPARRQESVTRSIMYALAWVTGLGLLAISAVAALIALIGGIASAARIAAAVATVVVLVLIASNRLNHRGACPGLHCSGCKGH